MASPSLLHGPRSGGRIPAAVRAAVCATAVLALSGCEPAGRAVGDTQDREPAVAYDGTDRGDVTVGVIGSSDPASDRPTLDALADSGLAAAYVSLQGSDDPVATACDGVEDMTARVVDAILVRRIDATASCWDDALDGARRAGIPVILSDPVHAPDDDLLYAAAFLTSRSGGDVTPLDDAVMRVIDDRPHPRTVHVTTDVDRTDRTGAD